MLESVGTKLLAMKLPVWLITISDLDRFAWLWIGSVQLALFALMAWASIRLVNRSAIWSHRIWLATLLLTLACLPVHWLAWGWMPLSISASRPNASFASTAAT